MSPLNRGPLLGPRMSTAGMRLPPPHFGRLPMPGMPPRMLPPPHSIGGMYGPMRPRLPPPRPGSIMRPSGPPSLFGARNRGPPPLMLPMMGPRGMGPRGPLMRPGPRGILPPQVLPHIRPRFPPCNSNMKTKVMNNSKKVSKLEELELKKPWMTDEIRNEIQKKNKLYAKAKKNKNAKEWEEFKDLRNKVTRMIRDAKNEYLAKNPDVASLYQDEPEYIDERDENNEKSEDEETYFYCEMCDREFFTEQLLNEHNQTHKICGIDGCKFIAHPKLVEKHIMMQHRTGLYHKIKNLSTPEEIAKWIDERKRKYPTKAYIESKKAKLSEKQMRGEIMEEKKSNITLNQTRHRVQARNRKAKKSRSFQEKKTQLQNVIHPCKEICPLAGIKNDCDGDTVTMNSSDDHQMHVDTNNITDDEEEHAEKRLPVVNSVMPLKSIGSLVADYDSDMDNDEPEELPIQKTDANAELLQLTLNQNTCVMTNASNKILPKEITSNKNSKNGLIKNKLTRNKKARSTMKSNKTTKKYNRQLKRGTLLQQLLSRSITHERNFICQCIKYIVDNNFFKLQ